MKTFEFIFELFDLKVRRLANGNKLRYEFEIPENLETEKELIEFRGERVNMKLTQEPQPENKNNIVLIESNNCEVFDIKCRRLKNGDKLKLVIESSYDKDQEIKAVKLRYDDCKVFLEKIEQELEFDEEEEDVEEYEE